MGRNCPSTIESHVIAEAMLNLQARLKYGQAILVKWESISARACCIDTENRSQSVEQQLILGRLQYRGDGFHAEIDCGEKGASVARPA